MKTLLRSMIVADPTQDNPKEAFKNYLKMDESAVYADIEEDQKIWEHVREFCKAHGHAPDMRTVRTYFIDKRKDEVLNRLEALAKIKALYRGDFEQRVSSIADEQRTMAVLNLLREAGKITQTGIEFQEKRGKTRHLKGPIDAVRYIMEKSHDVVTPTFGSKLSGEVTADGDSFIEQYERVELDPYAGVGNLTGLEQMDAALKGAKRHELWTHAAFTGGLKSTFILNWAYNQAVMYGNSSVIFSLEMPYVQCRNILYAMHALHDCFKEVRIQLGIQDPDGPTMGLDYTKIRDGQLSPNEKRFLVEHVAPQFAEGPSNSIQGHGIPHGKIHIEVADPDKSDFTVADLRAKAELIYAENPFQTIYVDHVGLMASRHRHSSTTERLNECIRDLKRLAMSFNRGQGIAVVALFQINREGYKRVLAKKEKLATSKNDGDQAISATSPAYNLTDLSYANEAERSSDIVTATWVDDELRQQGMCQFQCLKSRDQAPFEPFWARIEWPCRRMLSCNDIPTSMTKEDRYEMAAEAEGQSGDDILESIGA